MVAAIAAAIEPDALARRPGKHADHLRGDGFGAAAFQHVPRPLGIGSGLIPDRLEAVDPVLQGWVLDVRDPGLDRIVKAVEAQLCFSRTLVEFSDVLASPFSLLLPAIKDGGENGFKPLGLKKPLFEMVGDEIVEFLHRHGHATAGGRSLSCFHRTGVIAIAPAFAGADGHRPTTSGAMNEAREQCRATDNAGGHDLGVASLEQRLHGVEGFKVDDRRNRDGDDLGRGFEFLGLGALVELMLAHIGAAREDAVDLPDAPAPAITGEDAAGIEIGDDVLHPHLAGGAVSLQCEAIDQPYRVGMERVDLQLLLDLHPPRFSGDGAITDGRKRAVPEALPGILLQGAHDMLAILPGLILIEQRHDLPHHDMHGIVAHFLRDGDELHPILRKLPDIEFQLEMIAEEAAERMDHDHIEWRGFAGAGLDHPLELGAAIIGGRGARLDKRLDQRQPSREAIGLALPLLVRNGDIMLGLPRGRHAQVKGGA